MVKLQNMVNRTKVESYLEIKGYDFYQRKQLPNQKKAYLEKAKSRANRIRKIVRKYTNKNIAPKVLSLILSEIRYRYENLIFGKSKADISHPTLYNGVEELLEVIEAIEVHPENLRKVTFELRKTLVNTEEFNKEYGEKWINYSPPGDVDQNTQKKEIDGRILLKWIGEALKDLESKLKDTWEKKNQKAFQDIKDKSQKSIRADVQKQFARILLQYLDDHKIEISKNKKATLLCQLLHLVDLIPPLQKTSTNYKSKKHYYKQYGKNIFKSL